MHTAVDEATLLQASMTLVLCLALLAATPPGAAAADEQGSRAHRPGLPFVLFNDTGLQRPALHGLDETIDMQLEGYNDCSKLWLGAITFPTTGEVAFHAGAEQGLRLYIGGEPIIDGWGSDGARTGSTDVTQGQTLTFRLEWYHLGGEARMHLQWSWEGHQTETVPAQALSHTASDAEHVEAIAEAKECVAPGNVGPFPPVISAPAGDEPVKGRMYEAAGQASSGPEGALPLKPGPHLFIDDYLIAQSTNLVRRVNRPRRDEAIPNPVITGPEDRNFQPYMTMLRDADTGLFRAWYGMWKPSHEAASSRIGYMESEDGIHWRRPARALNIPHPIQFGNSLIDDGPSAADSSARYKLAWWVDGGLTLAVSPDGIDWSMLAPYPVLRHNHDINNIFYDTLRGRYVATLSVYTTGPTWSGLRRVTMQSTSEDLLNWSKPWYILTPTDGVDEGETQFYAMNGHLIRGGLWIGLVKVLRDDLIAEGTPEGSYGVGYTTLAWSRDGETWVRDPEPFFEPDPSPEAWDHAHAWLDYQLPVGDEVYIYYGGYKNGHKVNRFEERQIGLVRMARDRYVSRDAQDTPGELRTPLVRFQDSDLRVNAQVEGELRVRVLDEAGTPIPGFDYDDCTPIHGDSIDHAVQWQSDLATLQGQVVHLQFRLNRARLYGFELIAQDQIP